MTIERHTRPKQAKISKSVRGDVMIKSLKSLQFDQKLDPIQA